MASSASLSPEAAPEEADVSLVNRVITPCMASDSPRVIVAYRAAVATLRAVTLATAETDDAPRIRAATAWTFIFTAQASDSTLERLSTAASERKDATSFITPVMPIVSEAMLFTSGIILDATEPKASFRLSVCVCAANRAPSAVSLKACDIPPTDSLTTSASTAARSVSSPNWRMYFCASSNL